VVTKRALRLYVEEVAAGAEAGGGDGHSVLFPVAGILVNCEGRIVAQADGHPARLVEGPVRLRAGAEGVTLLRWEVSDAGNGGHPISGPGAVSQLISEDRVELDPKERWLLRCDRVQFPPKGVAYLHTHAGPGIRYLTDGTLTVEVDGRARDMRVGDPWFERGPDPVFAQAADEGAAFVRVFVLPASYKGRSSIRYVRPEDADKPKPQQYRIYLDQEVDLG